MGKDQVKQNEHTPPEHPAKICSHQNPKVSGINLTSLWLQPYHLQKTRTKALIIEV